MQSAKLHLSSIFQNESFICNQVLCSIIKLVKNTFVCKGFHDFAAFLWKIYRNGDGRGNKPKGIKQWRGNSQSRFSQIWILPCLVYLLIIIRKNNFNFKCVSFLSLFYSIFRCQQREPIGSLALLSLKFKGGWNTTSLFQTIRNQTLISM